MTPIVTLNYNVKFALRSYPRKQKMFRGWKQSAYFQITENTFSFLKKAIMLFDVNLLQRKSAS